VETLVLQQLAVSLGLGLLLGLQRERTEASIGGIRTFPLVALMGTMCAQLGQTFGGWIVSAGLLALAGVVIFANFAKLRKGEIDPGMTTEVGALLLYVLGAYLVVGPMAVAVVIAGAMALLLHLKGPMHRFAGRIGERDMRAIMQFVLLSLVILPVLPNQNFGPFGVLNLFKIWLMVVLIVGISLSGYVAYKIFGSRSGTVLGGILGGVISSTATAVSYARMTVSNQSLAILAALVIMISSCVSLGRVLIEIGAVAPRSFLELAPPLAAMMVSWCAIAGGLFFLGRSRKVAMPEQKNPAELMPALIFGGLYALVLLAVASAKQWFGSSGLYVVGILSGLTDMDAITLSTANLVEADLVEASVGWRTILIAALSNLVFKCATVALLGHRRLLQFVGVSFAIALTFGGLLLWLWPS
jgi:uncharacterized membrane protein (DUF4010 family)